MLLNIHPFIKWQKKYTNKDKNAHLLKTGGRERKEEKNNERTHTHKKVTINSKTKSNKLNLI